MNIYVVVEGRVVERVVYKEWIPLVNSALRYAPYIENVIDNHFFIVSGNGWPQYFEVVRAALEDVAANDTFSRLVICVDSEEMTLAEKYQEVDDFVLSTGIHHLDYRIVVQHFCFEAWALGNRTIGARNPKNPILAAYKKAYDVVKFDPEGLPGRDQEGLSRMQFAEKYLRLMLNDKNKNLTYSKNKPDHVAHPKFFSQLQIRRQDTDHIRSFDAFLRAFI